jgi:hypothetical protein
MNIERLTECRICGNKNLKTVVDLGEQFLSGRFPKIGTPDPPKAPLELVQCIGRGCCGLVQLAHRIPLDELYGDGYGYLSGTNMMMKKHLGGIVEKAGSLVKINKGDTVLDIGSNDGTLLRAYHNDGLKVGMDAPHFQTYYTGTHIMFLPGFFSASLFESWRLQNQPKIITSIAMFYDLPDPNQFVSDIKRTLHDDGIWILEQSYLPAMISKNSFDTICHEHLEYYFLRQIKWLCDKHGLKIFDYEMNDSNGGSIRVYVCHKESSTRGIAEIRDVSIDFEQFNKRIQDIRQRLTTFLKAEHGQGKSIHLYGASTKGNVLLQYMGIDYQMVPFAVDINQGKRGCWTPGTHILIMSPSYLKPDYYLVLPWHFREGFIAKEHDYLKSGGKLIFPLPEPEIVSMENDEIVVRQIQ